MSWKPINKVLVGALVGLGVFFAQKYVPGWNHGVSVTWKPLIPFAAAMITAYLVKLEKKL